MSSDILCSPDELRSQASFIKTQASDSQTVFNALRTRLEQLSTEFRGQAATAFDTRMNDWHTHAVGMVQALDSLGDWLGQAAEAIQATDQQLAQGLS